MSSTVTSSSTIHLIFDAALSEYAKQTGIDLATHPFAHTFQTCNSTDSIILLFQDRLKQFQAYRDGNRRLIDCLKPVVQVLHMVVGILGEAATLIPFQPAKAILIGIDVLLTASIGISTSYDALIDLFECVGNFLDRLQIYTEIPFSPSMSGIITKILVEVLSVLSLATKQIKQGRLKKFAKKLLGESEIEGVLHRLDRLTLDEARMTGTETLQVVHGLVSNMKLFMEDNRISMDEIRQSLVSMQNITSEINEMKRDQLQKDIRSWLSPPDPSKNYNIARAAQHNGTAEWFTYGKTFEEWNATGCLLWIHGKPGSGKSVLCSSVIQEVNIKCERGLAVMGYYYFDFKDVTKQGIRGLLTSLLAQFCAKSDPCYQILSILYKKNHAGSLQPNNDTLTECLTEMLRLPQQATMYIIVDAIDECPNTSGIPTAREEVLDFVEELVDLKLPNLRVCVTSRPEIDIQTVLGCFTSLNVSLHDQVGQRQAILDYICAFVHTDRRMRRWRSEDKQLVIDILSAKAEGMFRWVYCQLEALRRCFPNTIRRTLDELPATLDETYERTLLGIEKEKREYAHRLFQCLTVAVRPLHVDELAEVLAIRFDPGQVPEYHADWRLEDAQDAVLSACSSLVSVVKVDVNSSPVVQFSHFSVKEFLTSDRLAHPTRDVSCFHVRPHSAHTILAQASLSLLLHLGDRVDKNSIKEFPFAQYAAQHWVDHGQFDDVSLAIQDEMERLFEIEEPSFATWIWIYDIDHPFLQHMFEDRPPRPEAVPLYYAALCGFRSLVKQIIANHPCDINARGSHGPAVNAAFVKGHMEIALLLLEHGADVNVCNARNQSPLLLAAETGRRDHVESLLKHLADANLAEDRKGLTPLICAAFEGELEISKILLRHGATVDSLDKSGSSALSAAASSGHLDIVQLLIQNGATVDSLDNTGSTPLSKAAGNGHLDVVQLLIQSGASVDSSDNTGSTPLQKAAGRDRLDVVQLLIRSGATVEFSDRKGSTPLLAGVVGGHLDIVRSLIQSGATVNHRDHDGDTALMHVSQSGHLHVAEELLDHGAAINVQNNCLSTPLHLACANGHLSIVEHLVEHHANVDKQNKDQQTPLDRAAAYGQLDVACFLLKSGSCPNAQDSNGSTPLHTAAHHGRLNIVKLLLESGMDVNLRNHRNENPLDLASASGNREVTKYLANHMGVADPLDGIDVTLSENPDNINSDTPSTSAGTEKPTDILGEYRNISLHDAYAEGNIEVVQSLLDQGVDVDQRNTIHETALHLASENGNLEAAILLVKYGADVNCRAKTGHTPLHHASLHGHRDIVELLLDHGADLTAKTQHLRTPFHFASWNNYLEVVKLLLERGADIHSRDIDGRTPYELASRAGDRDIMRLIITHNEGRG